MDDSYSVVFGEAPRGAVCRERLAAYVVIDDSRGHVAVVSANFRGRDEFWLPGGGMVDSETPQQTVAREVREELGRYINLQHKIGQATQFFYAVDDGCWYKMVAHFFSGELQSAQASDAEHKLQWLDPRIRKSDFFHECHVWAALGAA